MTLACLEVLPSTGWTSEHADTEKVRERVDLIDSRDLLTAPTIKAMISFSKRLSKCL